jgi:hypothetical protein
MLTDEFVACRVRVVYALRSLYWINVSGIEKSFLIGLVDMHDHLILTDANPVALEESLWL